VSPAPAGPLGDATLRTSFVVVAPVLPGGWVLVEQGKVVSASPRRIRSISSGARTLRANVSLAVDETSHFTVIQRGHQGAPRHWFVACVATGGAPTRATRWDTDVDVALVCSEHGCSCGKTTADQFARFAKPK
jgi:hypothetical protein